MRRRHIYLGLCLLLTAACESKSAPVATTWGNFPERPARVYEGGGDTHDTGGAPATPNTLGLPGSPCEEDTDCQGDGAFCRHQLLANPGDEPTPIPGGMCTSLCNPDHNDAFTALNSDCPGEGNTCFQTSLGGLCYVACTARNGFRPCTRDGFACFYLGDLPVCKPLTDSHCDPTRADSCAEGSNRRPQVCMAVGPDPVGYCYETCDVLAPNCSAEGDGCYVDETSDDGTCYPAGVAAADEACHFLSDCAAGLDCLASEGGAPGFACADYCGGPDDKPCAAPLRCVDWSSTIPASKRGYCAR